MVSGDRLYTSLGILLFSLQQSNYQNNASDKLLSDTFMTLETTLPTLKRKAKLQQQKTHRHQFFLTLLVRRDAHNTEDMK